MSTDLPIVPPITPPKSDFLTPYNVAIIVDNVVHMTMNLDGQNAAIMLSNPTIVQCDREVVTGMLYDPSTKTFTYQPSNGAKTIQS